MFISIAQRTTILVNLESVITRHDDNVYPEWLRYKLPFNWTYNFFENFLMINLDSSEHKFTTMPGSFRNEKYVVNKKINRVWKMVNIEAFSFTNHYTAKYSPFLKKMYDKDV